MSSYCEDCGCRTQNGICSNCQEELFIGTFQSDCIEEPLSKEFQEKMAEQEAYLESKQ